MQHWDTVKQKLLSDSTENTPTVSRQVPLDTNRTRDGLKVLEKFCKRKYRNSAFLSVRYPSSETVEAASIPEFLSPQQTLTFNFPSIPNKNANASEQSLFERPMEVLSPTREFQSYNKQVNFADFPADFREPKFREEIKFDKGTESRKKYIFRVLKVLYRRLGLKYVLLLIFLIAYGLLGGLLFYYLEAPTERALITKLTHESNKRHYNLTQQLLYLFSEDDCYSTVTNTRNSFFDSRSNASATKTCNNRIEDLLRQYDTNAGINPDKRNNWSWNDYWNAVFYCATIFTTIGYGNMSCRTRRGRFATICYALFGVPYMLVVLNSVGKVIFQSLQGIWERSRRLLRRKTKSFQHRYIHKYIVSSVTTLNKGSDDNALAKNGKGITDDEGTDAEESIAENEIFETFPLYLALIIIFVYIGICSLIFCIWEEWDYFTAFYFFFISLTTVGLGDEMPDHPHYACLFFVFFLIGLALVSMCVSIMQMRVENQYMAALQIIEEEQMSTMNITPTIPPNTIQPPPSSTSTEGDEKSYPNLSPNLLARTAYGIRWRASPEWRFAGHLTPSNVSCDDSSERIPSTSTASGPQPQTPLTPITPIPPPVLGVFIARTRNTLKQGRGSKRKKEEENQEAEKIEDAKQQPTLDQQERHDRLSTASASGLHNFTAPLSVITEASDEEINEQMQKDGLSKPPLLKVIGEDDENTGS